MRHRWQPLLILLIPCIVASMAMAQSPTGTAVPNDWLAVSEAGPWVVTITLPNREAAQALEARIDVWSIHPREPRLEALISAEDYERLLAEGFELRLEADKTRTLAGLGIPLKGQVGGIPGFPCYRTVEETYATASAIAAAHPDLASWIDVGDSWEKIQDSQNGYDLRVLRLTQSAVTGPKPVFFASFAIHAREYTTAELGTRFAEFLVDQYDVDPNITWLLDHHEVHLMLQANPDGRKRAETGILWRKNTNNNYCSNTNNRGVDLNRNFEFEWDCCGGSSGGQCSPVYRGPTAASEPEIQVLQNYVKSIFPDQRGAGLKDPAPDDATGVAIDVHASGQLVLWPWGFEAMPTGNGTAFATLGRKLGFFNDSLPLQIRDFTLADGSSADFFYGELGVAGFGFELGTQFFESCTEFESNILQIHLDALFYAAKVARTPYLTPAGPEAFDAAVSLESVTPGDLVLLTANLDDTRFNQSNGIEATQTVASAEAFIDLPPWDASAVPIAMASSDGTFDEGAEVVEVMIDTTGLVDGRHTLFVQGTDSDGQIGVVAAAFLEVKLGIFSDGFESGDTINWSATIP